MNSRNMPAMLAGNVLRKTDKTTVQRPFRLVPFFDPGPWGGRALVEHLTDFLLELGDDFAFIGRQKRLRLDDTWFRIALLFSIAVFAA